MFIGTPCTKSVADKILLLYFFCKVINESQFVTLPRNILSLVPGRPKQAVHCTVQIQTLKGKTEEYAN